jgi:aryl-alcohol dehydrogenase-like predicted oxidoreductase
MQYRGLGSTGLDVSVVGVGTWQLGGEWGTEFSADTADAVLGRAADLGVNLVDTAECYGDHLAEELVGKAIARTRDRWVIATKFGHRYLGVLDRRDEWSPSEVEAQLVRSLRALGTDRIDIYLFHSGNVEALLNDELWAMLHRKVEAGSIRHLGISVDKASSPEHVEKALDYGVEVIETIYNRLDRDAELFCLPRCIEDNLGVMSREALAMGVLTGKYAADASFQSRLDPRAMLFSQDQMSRRLEEAARLKETEVPEGTEMATWAVEWCLRHPAVSTVLTGCKSAAQLEANVRAADLVDPTHRLSARHRDGTRLV